MVKIISIVVLVLVLAVGLIMYVNQNPSAPDTTKLSLDDSAKNAFKNPNATAANQQTQQQAAPSPSPQVEGVSTVATNSATAIIKTEKGDITIQLFSQDAPNTVQNFINKANSGFYNNLDFHRVEDWVVQGGDPKGDGTGGGTMPTELNNKPFVVGSVGVARGSDIKVSNDAQFFITKQDASWLNGQYTNFGQVTDGMDVVNKLQIGDKILGITIE